MHLLSSRRLLSCPRCRAAAARADADACRQTGRHADGHASMTAGGTGSKQPAGCWLAVLSPAMKAGAMPLRASRAVRALA